MSAITMNSDEIIESLLKQQKVKQDINVVELYLGKNHLRSVNNLGRFRMLQRVWLNSNKLRHLLAEQTFQSFLKDNFRITELYLQCNEICTIEGTLSHLRYLQVLMLQKNQLASLQEVLQELIPLQALRVLNMFDNPLAQEAGYRLLVIHTLPSVELLDRQEVTAHERKQAREIHRADHEAIRASVAFGRRADINPALLHTLQKPIKTYLHAPPKNHLQIMKERGKLKRKNLEHRRSVMQYTTLDWSRVPNSEQRRLGQAVPPPQNLTVKFR